MKIVIKLCLVMGVSIVSLLTLSAGAQDAVSNAAPSLMPSVPSRSQIAAVPVAAPPQIATPNLEPIPSVIPPAMPIIGMPDKDVKDPHDAKIPDSVKTIVKRLGTTKEDFTLEDLNAAREAVAKLDALIDIEKRMSDLANIRKEREDKSLTNAIPASALNPKGGMPTPPMPTPMMPPFNQPALMPSTNTGNTVLERISGANGHYVAWLKVGDAKAQQYRVGDKLSSGETVKMITDRSVSLENGKNSNTIKIKNVDTVFGGL